MKVIECNNPWKSPIGKIPFLQAGTEHFFSPNDVSAYLRSKVGFWILFKLQISFKKNFIVGIFYFIQNFSADYGLSSVECSETLAYMEYIWDTLQIAYQYFG